MNLPKDRITKFRRIVEHMEGSASILISQVDPDAIGSARALAWIIGQIRPKNGFEIKTFFAGAISHPQNVALVSKFDLGAKMRPMSSFGPNDNKNVILVDSSSIHDARLGLPTGIRIDPVMVIDHHRGGDVKEGKDSFIWVEDVGAASTLLVILAISLGFQFDDSNITTSTLLALGIHTDTGSLTSYTPKDLVAYSRVASAVPSQELAQLFRYPLPPTYYKNYAKALANEVMVGGTLVTHIGIISAAEGDDISTIADSLIRRTGITLVLVWGIIGGVVRLSARNADITRPLGSFLGATFPRASSGAKLSGDGRGIGGATINLDIGDWMNSETSNEVVALVSKWICSKVFGK